MQCLFQHIASGGANSYCLNKGVAVQTITIAFVSMCITWPKLNKFMKGAILRTSLGGGGGKRPPGPLEISPAKYGSAYM